MRTMRRSVITTMLVAAAFGLAGCGASTDTAGPASSSDTRLPPVQQIAESVFQSCQDGDMGALRDHLTDAMASLDWENACSAVRDHLVTFRVGTASSPPATTAAVHATMHSDVGRHDDDWEFVHGDRGWELAAPPEMLTGGWDHDDHRWLSPSTPTAAHAPHADDAERHGYTPSTNSSSTTSSAATGTTTATTGRHEAEPPATHLGGEPDTHDVPAPTVHDEGELEPHRPPPTTRSAPTATSTTNAMPTTAPHRDDDTTSHDSGGTMHDDTEH